MSGFTDNLRTTKVLLTKFNRLVLFASACFRVLQLGMKARAVRCYITHERNFAVTKFGRRKRKYAHACKQNRTVKFSQQNFNSCPKIVCKLRHETLSNNVCFVLNFINKALL
jgi:hypothetical protein